MASLLLLLILFVSETTENQLSTGLPGQTGQTDIYSSIPLVEGLHIKEMSNGNRTLNKKYNSIDKVKESRRNAPYVRAKKSQNLKLNHNNRFAAMEQAGKEYNVNMLSVEDEY